MELKLQQSDGSDEGVALDLDQLTKDINGKMAEGLLPRGSRRVSPISHRAYSPLRMWHIKATSVGADFSDVVSSAARGMTILTPAGDEMIA